MRCAAVILAAGAGSRFAERDHKLCTVLDDDPRPLWQRAVDAAVGSAIGPVVVVSGALTLPTETYSDLLDRGPMRIVRAPRWRCGQAASLRAAIEEVDGDRVEAIVVGLADQPGIPSATWRAIADSPDTTPIVAARYPTRRGPHPIRLRRDIWPALPDFGDDVARRLLQRHPQWVTDVNCLGSVDDIDTMEDARAWNSCATNSR